MTYTVISDIHLGCKRQGGTTPQSQQALKDYLQKSFYDFLHVNKRHDLIIAGDLFDNFEVDPRDILACFSALQDFTADSGRSIVLIAGNHDYSPKGSRLSSFHFLAALLQQSLENEVQIIDSRLTEIDDGLWAIPHMPNQDLFDLELGKALRLNPEDISALKNPITHLILHANYDNKFCLKSDHSLNVSREVAQQFAEKGITLLFAHEHQAKADLGGKVVILGNQWPSSVADCLGNDFKCAHTLEGGELKRAETWSRAGPNGYAEIDWRDLDAEVDAKFIRITGTALAEEAEAVIEAISKYRAKSSAFVVGNAVKVDGLAEMDSLEAASAETIKSFDVFGALLEGMSERESEVLRSLV